MMMMMMNGRVIIRGSHYYTLYQ